MSGNWEYGKQICKQGSILSLVTLCEHCRAVGSCTRNCVDGKGVQRGCSRGFWAPSAMLRSSPVLWLLLRLKLWSSLLTRLLSFLCAYSAHCTPVHSRNYFSGCRGRRKRKKYDCLRTGKKCLMKQRMCVVRFFLFGFNCTPCGTCCVCVML